LHRKPEEVEKLKDFFFIEGKDVGLLDGFGVFLGY
jgi:hypothetical protein